MVRWSPGVSKRLLFRSDGVLGPFITLDIGFAKTYVSVQFNCSCFFIVLYYGILRSKLNLYHDNVFKS